MATGLAELFQRMVDFWPLCWYVQGHEDRAYGWAGTNETFRSEVSEMAATFFHVEERRAWVRTSTHTVVYDRDPDYPRFEKNPDGTVKRMLRIWLAEPKEGGPYPLAYLGTVMFCFGGPSFGDLCRLFHLTSRASKAAGQPAKVLRAKLAALLRKYIQEEYTSPTLRLRL